jgi:hypothetical protein
MIPSAVLTGADKTVFAQTYERGFALAGAEVEGG